MWKKELIYISFISLLILFWSGTANAKIILEAITASPDPAKVNNDVKITFHAYEDTFQSILAITPLISPPTGKKITYNPIFCSKDSQPVSNCSIEITFKPDKIGKYTIEGSVIPREDAASLYKKELLSFAARTLTVNETGALPTPPAATAETPVIQKITVNGMDTMFAAINSQIEIYGPGDVTKKGFCSVSGDINLSQIKIIFSQASSNVSTGWLAGSTCDVLKARVPDSLASSEQGTDAKVRVQNTAGISNEKILYIKPAIVAPWEETSTSPLPGQKQGNLQVKWPKNPLMVSLQGDSLTNLVEYLYGWGISLGGFAAFVVLTMAGVQYLTSAGDAGKMKDAMDKIRNAAIGLVMLFASVLILNTINPQLTQLRMPSTRPESVSLGTSTDNLRNFATEPCGGAKLYSAENYQPEPPVILEAGEYRCKDLDITVNSIRVKGSCQVKLSEKLNCAENENSPAIIIFGDTPRMSFYGKTRFSSVQLIDAYINTDSR